MGQKLRTHSTLAWAAIVLGLLFGIAGILHTTAVISVALRQGKPYDFRLVSLIATGGILIYPGLINIGISRWIKQGHPWALAMSAVVTLPLLVYEALLAPARHSMHLGAQDAHPVNIKFLAPHVFYPHIDFAV